MKRLLALLAVLLAAPAWATQSNLASTYALGGNGAQVELTDLETEITVTGSEDKDRFVLLNLRVQNSLSRIVQVTLTIERDDVVIATDTFSLDPSQTTTVQLPYRDLDLSNGTKTYEALVSASTGGLTFTTATYLLVQGFDVVLDSTVESFLDLDDTPSAYTGEAGQFANVNAGETAVEFDALVAADIPSLAASKITSGQLALAQGGTGADLSATGAANSFLKQSSSGAVVTVGTIADADVPNTITIDLATTATTATALAANGANCSAGNYPLGVDASGAAESCTADDDVPEAGDFGALALTGDVTSSGLATTIGNDKVLEAHLKAVDAAVDEECLTYESTTGDFEWQTCGSGGGYATVEDETTPLTQRTTLNFEGAGVTCADDTDQTTCTIPGGGGGAGVFQVWTANQSIGAGTGTLATQDTRNGHPVLDFNDAADECSYFGGVLSPDYAGGGLTFTIYWMATSATTGATGWLLAIGAHPDDALDLDSDSFAADNSVSATTATATGEVDYATIAFTDGADMDSLAAGESYRARLCRDGDGSVVTDDMTGDAELYKLAFVETPA